MKYLVSILVSLGCFSCATKAPIKPDPSPIVEDCDLEKLKPKFYIEAEKHGLSLFQTYPDFFFVDKITLPGCVEVGAIGCSSGTMIQFDKKYWESIDCNMRECLYFHEMGHWRCGLPHINPPPPHIMQPSLMDGKTYSLNREEYLKELFRECIKP